MSIAIVLQARKNSQRCKNKMLRKFDESSLFEIQIKKFQKLTNNFNVYCAVGEKPFLTILKNYKKINLITRNKISVESDLIENVFNYLNQIEENTICFINPCSPFLKASTVRDALNLFNKLNLKSLTSVIEKKTWYFDHNSKPINDNSKCNTKILKAIYECSHSFHIFNKKFFIKNKKYWNNKKNDPYLFKIENVEALDIDTEEEFKYIEKIYKALKNSTR
tara:strand:+ start:2781 stop:3443 length:663 start_codon:yes stop_codon:yes gene_type:complete